MSTAIAPAPTTDKPTTAKLIVPPEQASQHIRALLERGGEIASLRIRNGDELDEARGHKLVWSQDCNDLLAKLFDNSSVADYCNDWVGKIFPEYAEFGNFVEQFFEEMQYRLGKLKTVLKRVEVVAEPPAASPAPEAVQPASFAPPASLPFASPVHTESAMPATSPPSHGKVLFVTHGSRDATAEAVLALLQQLSLPTVQADHTNGLIETLEASSDTCFVVVMHNNAPDAVVSEHSMFKLGYCAGRLGIKRMCMVHGASHSVGGDAHGMPHVAIDANGGWQLHLARQMKRAGLEIDLNRLC